MWLPQHRNARVYSTGRQYTTNTSTTTRTLLLCRAVRMTEKIVSGRQSATPCQRKVNKSAQSGRPRATMASVFHIYNEPMTKACSANWVPTETGRIFPPNSIAGVYLTSRDTNIDIIFLPSQAFPSCAAPDG